MSIEIIDHQQTSVLLPKINQHLSKLITPDWFDIDHWKLHKAVTGESRGRNVTWFIGHTDGEWVLRHYYRGGMVARFIKDQYLFRNFETTRCYRELKLLEQMHSQGLPVPKPIAACVRREGLFYRADILIEKIPTARDLVKQLTQQTLPEASWHAIGAMVAKFHQAGIFHADLNAHNILLDDEMEFWLIDFDRCETRSIDEKWQKANLARLKRSFLKEKGLHETFYFDAQQWHWLIQGYELFSHRTLSKAG